MEPQLPRAAQQRFLGGEAVSSVRHLSVRPPRSTQQPDPFARYQPRYEQQQPQQVPAHGHGAAAHARSPEGQSPGTRAAALALGGVGLRLQSPEGLLAHAHMVLSPTSSLDRHTCSYYYYYYTSLQTSCM